MSLEDSREDLKKNSSNYMLNNSRINRNYSILSKITDIYSYHEELNNFNDILFTMNKRNITDEEINSTPILKILGVNNDIFFGQEILINAAGLVENKNIQNSNYNINKTNFFINENKNSNLLKVTRERTGLVLFGPENFNNNKNFISVNYNQNKFFDFNNIDIFFYIYYMRETKKYHLIPNINSIIFMKLNHKFPYVIKIGEFLSIENKIILIRRIKRGINNNYLKIEYENKENVFRDQDYFDNNKCIKIGRGKNCDIIIKDNKNISRVNCVILFNNKIKEWELYDGDGKDKESLNGTRILLRSTFVIFDGCEFEFLGQRLMAKLIDNKNMQ